jgi:peroxiredoxin-like protein
MPPTTTHRYPVSVAWTGGRRGSGTLTTGRTGVALPLSVPPEFGGTETGHTNPEELLASAIAGCYAITFGIIADHRKLPVVAVRASAEGEVDQAGATFTYARIVVRPQITLSADATDAQMATARDLALRADAHCIVTNALRDKVQVRIEPEIVRASA